MTSRPSPSTAAVRSKPPPRWLMSTVINPVVRRLVPLLSWRSGPLLVLRFTGRRSGRTYAVPAVGHDLDGSPVVLTDARWALNFRGGHPVTVLGGGRPTQGRAHLVDSPTEAAEIIRRVLDTASSPRALGLCVAPGHRPTDDELVAVRRVVRLP